METIWFALIAVTAAVFVVMDGFDFGAGALHLVVARTDGERREVLAAIGPLWDGNEVWLVTFGGALFAAFPHVYATVFSGFYTAFMLLLFALILRAVSMEFRSKRESPAWRSLWDWGFFTASFLATLLFGVAVGNCLAGLPIGADMEMHAPFLSLLRPYPVLVGLFAVATAAMHGAIYLLLKTSGELQERIQGWAWRAFGLFLVFYLFTTIATLQAIPTATANFQRYPAAWIVVVLNVLAIANIPRSLFNKKPLAAFASSAGAIAAFTFLFGVALFPNLAVSRIDPSFSLTIYNAASSEKTLSIMRTIAFLGLPFVLSYTTAVYWIFRGKVELGKFSY